MATTDSNGLVLLQQTDNLTPLEGTINTVTSSVSAALNANTRIFQVANQAARDTLANSRTPTANNPLFVWRQDTKEMEYNYGTGWGPFPTPPAPNTTIVNGWLQEKLVDNQYRWTRRWIDATPLPITTAWGTVIFYATKTHPALPAGAVVNRVEAVSLSDAYWCNATTTPGVVQFMRPGATTVSGGINVSLTAYGTL